MPVTFKNFPFVMNKSNVRSLKESFHPITAHFWKEVNNLKEASTLIAYNIKRSRDNGWQNVSIPYHDALAVMEMIEESSMRMGEIFEGTKQTAILADKNRAIAEHLYAHPIERTFEKFIQGEIQEDELTAHINRVFSVKRHAA